MTATCSRLLKLLSWTIGISQHVICNDISDNLQYNTSNSLPVISAVSSFCLFEGGATLSLPGAQTARTNGAGSLHESALNLKVSCFDYVNAWSPDKHWSMFTLQVLPHESGRVAKKGKP